MLEISESSVIYQAKTKLIELAYEVASTRNYTKPSAQAKIRRGFNIYKSLQALDYGVYLTQEQRQKIVYCLISQAGINDYPVAPVLGSTTPPAIQVGIQGPTGPRGARGEDGGATDFGFLDQGTDSVADEFLVSDAYAARWDYIIYDNTGANRRSGTITCDWSSDGLNISVPAELSSVGSGNTEDVQFSVDFFGGNIRLIATITDGIWNVQGSRYFIPNNGAGTGVINTVLADGKIFVGNSSSVATAVTPSGDATLSNLGVITLTPGVIVNATISGSAAIAFSKMASLTASRATVTNGAGVITTSVTTATELGYVSGVTSSIQAQLDTKLGNATGAISTVVSVDLTPSKALVSNPSGKIAISGTTSIELGYLSGATSNIQTQIGGKVSKTGDSMTGALTSTSTIQIQGGFRTEASGAFYKVKTVSQSWNMVSSVFIDIPHGLSASQILFVRARIDPGSGVYFNLESSNGASASGSVSYWNSTTVRVSRAPGGTFDSAGFSGSTCIITIFYTA